MTTLRPAEIPLLILVLVTVPLLILHRDAFDQRIDLSPLQIAALSSVVGVLLYGTIGSYAIRDQFVELETWADAVYYVLVTIATVGYGDITPTTTGAKWFSLSIIVFGTGAFTAAIGALVVPAIEKRMANALGNMTASELSLLDDHVLVLGYTDVTESLLEAIGDETDVVVVTENEDAASSLADRDINVLTADPATESTLQDAKIEAASGVVVATHDDANTVLTVLATRKAHPDVRIVAAAADRRHADKLEAVGADTVVSPVEIGGRLLGRSILEETDTDTLLGVDDEESNTKTDEDG
ncbi:NAD-binding protein [Halorubrum vacuolatum]|uniref:NAD-binding protein n=1 Tax=Halorubrum vacuolatum TaxID=63740 RepID=UPI001C52D018|nr:NAD-binding protein [Halorubrum vacuolatum]